MGIVLAALLAFMTCAVVGVSYLFIAYLRSDVRWLRERLDSQTLRAETALDEIVSRSTGTPIHTAQPLPIPRDLQTEIRAAMEHDGLVNAGRIDE